MNKNKEKDAALLQDELFKFYVNHGAISTIALLCANLTGFMENEMIKNQRDPTLPMKIDGPRVIFIDSKDPENSIILKTKSTFQA